MVELYLRDGYTNKTKEYIKEEYDFAFSDNEEIKYIFEIIEEDGIPISEVVERFFIITDKRTIDIYHHNPYSQSSKDMEEKYPYELKVKSEPLLKRKITLHLDFTDCKSCLCLDDIKLEFGSNDFDDLATKELHRFLCECQYNQ